MISSETVQSITLRRFDSGESDRRLVLLTREAGKIVAFARGVRKPNSKKAWLTEPLMVANVQIDQGRTAKTVRQAEILRAFPGIRADYDRISAGLALGEFVAKVIPEDAVSPEPFELLLESLGHLDGHPNPQIVLLWSLIKFIELEGHLPVFDQCVVCGRKLKESPAWASTSAGGNLCIEHSESRSARLEVRAEALIGLARLVELEAPPPKMKYLPEAFSVLYAFALAMADSSLPAFLAVLRSFDSESGNLDLR